MTRQTTPMMQQWEECKKVAGEALLLFRMGDFYEAFHQDAEVVARELELTLTKRQDIPMSGVPWHSADGYIDRLVAKGFRIAIAEQMEDPRKTKGLVKRAVTRFVTPGTSSQVAEKANNFLAGLAQVGSLFGLALLDMTTGEFQVIELEAKAELRQELARFGPSEIVASPPFFDKHSKLFEGTKALLSPCPTWHFDHQTAYTYLARHFHTPHLDGFGLKAKVAAINAAGALLAYVHEELALPIEHIRHIRPLSLASVLSIDAASSYNLDLDALLKVLDKTETAMGGRLLARWLKAPLRSLSGIQERQEAIEVLRVSPLLSLTAVRDLQRLTTKVVTGSAHPRDLVALATSLAYVGPLRKQMQGAPLIERCRAQLSDFTALITHIQSALTEEGLFRPGYDEALDGLHKLSQGGKEWIASYQNTLRDELGIKTLKVSFNRVFGYYIEVSKGAAHQMPASFERRQTLANCERFISPELKEYEAQVLTAEDRMQALENELFKNLLASASEHADALYETASALATLDTLQALAKVATLHSWVRPSVEEGAHLEIIQGRHPVVEEHVGKERFIPNDTLLDGERERLMLITGPNMAGKSTYIRQVALIVILAQMGACVPAERARLGLCDKIFTRIGASDDLGRGQSTFMVEMSETANILNNVTSSSLVILDEIGRGTSTYDGVSIAWAVAEYLLTTEGKRAKTLFATHYFELASLEEEIAGAVNYHAQVEEWNEEIVFVHRVVRGAADRSYGIHVARLAGLPFSVVARAQEILGRLEQAGPRKKKFAEKKAESKSQEKQLTLF